MDADWYVVEKMIQARRAEAHTRARFVALPDRSTEHPRQSQSITSQLVDLCRSLLTGRRKEFLTSRAQRSVGPRSRTHS